jgi:teichuronic acid exporter
MTITPPAMGTVRQLTRDGVFWNGLETVVRIGFQFGISIALARLLTPEEFGIVALAYVFTNMAAALVESGFSAPIVQQRDLEELEISAMFHFQWAISLIAAIGLGAISPLIAKFYGYPVLEPLIWVISLTLFLRALGGVHGGLLSRTLNFQPLMIAGTTSTLLGGMVAVFLAFKGFGVWALAVQAVVAAAVNTAAAWLYCRWRPQMVFRPKLLKRSFAFRWFVLLSGLLEAAYGSLYWLVIGKIYGAADLGQYNRAAATQNMPVGMLTGIVSRVAFPAFSAVQDDGQRLRAGLRKATTAVMVLNAPAMLGLLAIAEPLVLTLFGEVWRPSVPLLQILCLAGLIWPLHLINLNVLLAQGHSRLFFWIEVAKKAFGVLCAAVALPFGLEALAWSQVLYGFMCFAIHAHYTHRLLGYGLWAQLLDCLPWFFAGTLMACTVWLLQFVLPISVPSLLVVQTLLGATLYFGFCLIWDPHMFREMMLTLIPRLKNVKA